MLSSFVGIGLSGARLSKKIDDTPFNFLRAEFGYFYIFRNPSFGGVSLSVSFGAHMLRILGLSQKCVDRNRQLFEGLFCPLESSMR